MKFHITQLLPTQIVSKLITKLSTKRPNGRLGLSKLQAAAVVIAIAGVGSICLISSKAATPTANVEAESGTLSGSASVVGDSSASGASAVKFGSVNVVAGTPVSTATPQITDSTVANRLAYADALTASGDSWTVGGTARNCGAATGMVCGYQWQRSTNGTTWANIINGDCTVLCQRTYRLQIADVGAKLRVIITAGTAQGSAEIVSTATGSNAVDLSCDYNVSTASSLNSNYQSASAGQVICLASGTYSWSPTVARASGANIIVKPAANAAVTMSFNPTNASRITLAGPLTLTTSTFDGTTNNVTIYNATLQSGSNELIFFTDKFNNSNILVDAVTFSNQTGPHGELTHGRIRTDFHTTDTHNIIGLTVSNSYFSGGAMIDVLSEGGAGLTILNNEFYNVDNSIDESIHSDTIFDYGDGATTYMVMKNNWFHDMNDIPGCGWTQWDGGGHNVFENNVISHIGGASGTDGCYESMAVNADDSSVISHNVLVPGKGIANSNLGNVLLGYKTADGTKGTGTTIRDNTMSSIDNGGGGGNSNFFEDHNLCTDGCSGTVGDQGTAIGNLTGSPTWIGASAPTSYTGFGLAASSRGIGKASDGTNMGLELPTDYRYPR